MTYVASILNKNLKLNKDLHICFESKTNLEEKVAKLEFDLNASNATLEKFNAGSKVLDEIICVQKNSLYMRGLRYVDKPSSSFKLTNKDIFIKPKNCGNNIFKSNQTKGSPRKIATNFEGKSSKFNLACHHCCVHGHIRPHCGKLNRTSKPPSSLKNST